MKQTFYCLLIALCCAFTLSSCHDDDDNINVPESVQAALTAKYPDATRVSWENKAGYYVAEFYANSTEIEVWFNKDSQWCMTETDYGRNMSSVPVAVKSAFENSEYSTWNIDDINKYERNDITFYVIEVESRGQRDHYLFYGENGNLIKDTTENGNDNIFPLTPVL